MRSALSTATECRVSRHFLGQHLGEGGTGKLSSPSHCFLQSELMRSRCGARQGRTYLRICLISPRGGEEKGVEAEADF